MNRDDIKKVLEDVKSGNTNIDDALDQLKKLPFEDLGFVKIDHHRGLRKGFPEVIFCQGKTPEQVRDIFKALPPEKHLVMGTRADKHTYETVKSEVPDAQYFDVARIIVSGNYQKDKTKGTILVLCAGTSDIPVAEEAVVTAQVMGNRVERLYDVGVAGVHRLFKNSDKLLSANALVVVAGMEGALASLVGGLVSKPVIAVPTSVGYGASFNGLAALLSMLNSCAPGVAVVNIDNGFGAGYMAGVINKIGENE